MITTKHIDGQGNVHLWDLGPTKVRMAAVDARHAIETEPERWALVDPENPDRYEAADQRVDLSATAIQEEQTTTERSESEKGSG